MHNNREQLGFVDMLEITKNILEQNFVLFSRSRNNTAYAFTS